MRLGMVAMTTAQGYERLLYHQDGGRQPVRESDRGDSNHA
jgi:hypothetical protein